MAALSTAFKIDYPENGSMIQGMSCLITATFTGDATHKPVKGKDSISLTSKNKAIQILPGYSTPVVDDDNNTIVQKFMIIIGPDKTKKVIDLNFATTVKDVSPQTFNYPSLAITDINPDAFTPLVSSNPFIQDNNPAADNKDPGPDNSGILVDVYAKKALGDSLITQIPLRVDFGYYIRIYAAKDDGSIIAGGEIFPAQQDSPSTDYLRVFYIPTDKDGHATIKIFPRKMTDPAPVTAALSVYFPDYGTLPGSSSLFFVTVNLDRTVKYPVIYELDGGNRLTPPANGGNFHAIVPRYKGAKPKDKIFFINSYSGKDSLLGMLTIEDDADFNIPVFSVPYAAITNTGLNHLYYYTVNLIGNVARSENLVYNMTKHASNKPDESMGRVFLEPKISDGNGEYLSDDTGINMQTLSFGDMTCHVPVNSSSNTVSKGDVVGVHVYVNGYDLDGSVKVGKLGPPDLKTQIVQQTDVDAGVLNFKIPPGTFSGYDSDNGGNPGIVYIEYFTIETGDSDRYSHIWVARIDTVPQGRSNNA